MECADPGWLDLVLEAVRRRLAHDKGLNFAAAVSTRPLPAGGGVAMKRSGFQQLSRGGGLAFAWRCGERDYGHSIELLARLTKGETVIAGVGADVVAEARGHWHDVRIARLAARTDRGRSALTPRACLSRLAGVGGQRQPGLERLLADNVDVTVHDTGELGRTVRELAATIVGWSAEPRVSSIPPVAQLS